MLGVVRPHAVVVDMSMPKRDGCAIIAAVAALDPVPLVVVVTSAGDPAMDFAALLADPPRDTAIRRLPEAIEIITATSDETLPRIGQKQVAKLQVAQGPRWVG
jgi:DNA-binding NarL/FixJ family response regulator